MITSVAGNLFTSPAKVLVNTVNTVGVMGKGIAKTFKEVYPQMFIEYQKLCERKELRIGTLWLYKTPHKWILNFPTKQHWRNPSQAEYIEAGLKKFVSVYPDLAISSISFPKLGCGNGELDWESVVKPLMMKYLEDLPIDIFIYEFDAGPVSPEHRDLDAMYAWLRSDPRTLAFGEMWSDLCSTIGNELKLKACGDETDFYVYVAHEPEIGLRIRVGSKVVPLISNIFAKFVPLKWLPRIIGPEDIFVPQEAMLDLWQNIRAYGFCLVRNMPEGLDALAAYIKPLLGRLTYMQPVELSITTTKKPISEKALQLVPPPATPFSKSIFEAYAV